MNSDLPHLLVWAIAGIPEIQPGDDLVRIIAGAANGDLADGDILVVTSKIVSKSEGRYVAESEREIALQEQTVRVVAVDSSGRVRIVENLLGIVAAAAGIDASNTPSGLVLLLPENPDRSAAALAAGLRDTLGVRVGVIVSDTLGRAWREGQTDCAIGAAGVTVIDDLRGQADANGRIMDVTQSCVDDELASTADLVKGKASNLPVAVIRGRAGLVGSLDLPGAASIIRPSEKDLFRWGVQEAFEEGYAAGLRGGREGADGT